jgi:hypothetical protein
MKAIFRSFSRVLLPNYLWPIYSFRTNYKKHSLRNRLAVRLHIPPLFRNTRNYIAVCTKVSYGFLPQDSQIHPTSCQRILLPPPGPMAQKPVADKDLLIIEFSRLDSDTPHSLRLLWTSDQTETEISNWQQTALTRERQTCLRWDSNRQSQQASGRRPMP